MTRYLLLPLLPLVAVIVANVPGGQAIGAQQGPPAGLSLPGVCPATPPDSGRYATVRGTVRLASTNRPLAGVLLIINSCSFGYFGAWDFRFTGDSVRTDAQGHYELRFHSKENRGYAVLFDPAMGRPGNQPSRYVFHSRSKLGSSLDRPDRRFLKPAEVDTVNFAPDFAPNYGRPIDLHLPPAGH